MKAKFVILRNEVWEGLFYSASDLVCDSGGPSELGGARVASGHVEPTLHAEPLTHPSLYKNAQKGPNREITKKNLVYSRIRLFEIYF